MVVVQYRVRDCLLPLVTEGVEELLCLLGLPYGFPRLVTGMQHAGHPLQRAGLAPLVRRASRELVLLLRRRQGLVDVALLNLQACEHLHGVADHRRVAQLPGELHGFLRFGERLVRLPGRAVRADQRVYRSDLAPQVLDFLGHLHRLPGEPQGLVQAALLAEVGRCHGFKGRRFAFLVANLLAQLLRFCGKAHGSFDLAPGGIDARHCAQRRRRFLLLADLFVQLGGLLGGLEHLVRLVCRLPHVVQRLVSSGLVQRGAHLLERRQRRLHQALRLFQPALLDLDVGDR
mmetsp:Transcript_57784/g.163025  ORF Transcript_57784/g.163025 Transcript_57784/m.163025 type:complete len:288 (-) Transcript_57784:765-1628(-)